MFGLSEAGERGADDLNDAHYERKQEDVNATRNRKAWLPESVVSIHVQTVSGRGPGVIVPEASVALLRREYSTGRPCS